METTRDIRGIADAWRSGPVRWFLDRFSFNLARAPAGHPTGYSASEEWQEIFSGRDARSASGRGNRRSLWVEQAELWEEEVEHTDATELFAERPLREPVTRASARFNFDRVLVTDQAAAEQPRVMKQARTQPATKRAVQSTDIAKLMKINGTFDGAGRWANRFALPERTFSPALTLWKGSPVTDQPPLYG
jgi:hypothetical protein